MRSYIFSVLQQGWVPSVHSVNMSVSCYPGFSLARRARVGVEGGWVSWVKGQQVGSSREQILPGPACAALAVSGALDE